MANRLMSLTQVKDGAPTPRPELPDAGLSELYEVDEVAWLDEMARLIEENQREKLDYPNLKDCLQDMAIRERREAKSRLIQLIGHLLKWQYQSRKRSRSWESTITVQRFEMEDILDSKTLLHHVKEKFDEIYRKAVTLAMQETGLDRKDFPTSCPYSMEFILSEEFPLKKKS